MVYEPMPLMLQNTQNYAESLKKGCQPSSFYLTPANFAT